jgi:hypothetical protein
MFKHPLASPGILSNQLKSWQHRGNDFRQTGAAPVILHATLFRSRREQLLNA